MKTITALLFHFTVLAFGCQWNIVLNGEVVSSTTEFRRYLEINDFAELLVEWDKFLIGALPPAEENRFLKRFDLERAEGFHRALNQLLTVAGGREIVASTLEADRKNRFGQWLLARAKNKNALIPISELVEGFDVTSLYKKKTRREKIKRLFETASLQHHVFSVEAFLAANLGEGQPYRFLRNEERSAFFSRLQPMPIPMFPNTVEKMVVTKYQKQKLILGIDPINN